MKKSLIKIGGFYTDNKQGLREVIDAGPQYRYYDSVEDDDCLRIKIHSAPKAGTDPESNITRASLATWAKDEVPADQVPAFILAVAGEKAASKLTKPQYAFLETIDLGVSPTDELECNRDEFRVGKACEVKGLINPLPEKLEKDASHFYIQLTELGVAVLEAMHRK